MSLCPYGSVIQPPPLTQQQQHRHYPIPLLRHPLLCRSTPLFLTPNHTLISSTTTSVLHRDLGAELAAPDSDDAVSNEFLDAPPQQNEEEPAPQPQVTRFRKKKEEQQDNGDTFDNRYKLRNGREVSLAQMEYQLPRLTKMWTHLERQAGGKVKGMGEKQIEVDKRILRNQIGVLKKELESVRKHRKQYRNRRFSIPVPVVSLVGYTNAGKSTLLNQLTGADVLAEDKLFATLDPTTRRVQMKNGKEFLLTDTVGFIQKLPTTLVAAFRATLEEISESSLLVHVVDISHPLAEQQINAVDKVLSELDVSPIPRLMVWNKVDKASDPQKIRLDAEKREDVICISALTGDGLQEFCNAVQDKLKDSMVWVEALLPFENGDLLSTIHQVGMVEKTEYTEQGTYIKAHVPLRFARLLTPMRQMCVSRP